MAYAVFAAKQAFADDLARPLQAQGDPRGDDRTRIIIHDGMSHARRFNGRAITNKFGRTGGHQLPDTTDDGIGLANVHSPFETMGRFTVNGNAFGSLTDQAGMEMRHLDDDAVRVGCHFAIGAAHDAQQGQQALEDVEQIQVQGQRGADVVGFAAVDDLLDTLIDQWRNRQRQFDRNDFDRLGRISCFMVADVLPSAAARGILAALSVAIVRLSELEN